MRRAVLIAAVALAAAAIAAPAQQPAAPAAFDLSVENLMRGPELYGTPPSRVRFSDDSRWVYFRWQRPGVDTAEAGYRLAVAGGEPERLTSIAEDTLYPEPGEWSRDRRLKVFAHRGDIYLWDAARGARRRLTDTPGTEGSAQLSGDAKTVFFVRDGNVFGLAIEGGLLTQLTDIRRGPAPSRAVAARDSAGQMSQLLERVVAVERVAVDTAAHPAPPSTSDVLPESVTVRPRSLSGLAIGIAVAGVVAALPSAMGHADLNRGLGNDATAYAVAGVLSVATIAGYFGGTRPLARPDNAEHNRRLREQYEVQLNAVIQQNRRLRDDAGVHLHFEGSP